MIGGGGGSGAQGVPPPGVSAKDWAEHWGQRLIDLAVRETQAIVNEQGGSISTLAQLAREG